MAASAAIAQTGVARESGGPQEATGGAYVAPGQSDQTLEVPPRIMALPPVEAPPPGNEAPASGNASAAPDGAIQNGVAAPGQERPYLGISVQYVETHPSYGPEERGLAVVSVDPNSPAEHAGLRGRGSMTRLGASGDTAGALMPPLNLILMPLLEESGQLGLSGDLIVAIDDKRIENETDLQDQIEGLKPGETIYFTVVRTGPKGARETLKIPVKLGDPEQAIANAGGAPAAQGSVAPPAASQPASR